MEIIQLTEYEDAFLKAINRLLPQLSSSAQPLSEHDLKKIIESENIALLFARADRRVLGSLTLVLLKIPTGTRARIEDVMVDSGARGRGVGKRLIERAMQLANESGAKTIDLTSHPSREAANALYKKVGFEIRGTTVYRYTVS